jgi:hypothetical protein
VKKPETCLSPSSAFNLSLSFNHGTLKIINRRFPEGIKKIFFSNLKVLYY